VAWYEHAQRLELQPESDQQPAIRPTQFILHSIAAPWTPRRIYEYWRDSTNLDCHFGLGFDGALAQFIGTETRADANAGANRRADGTGAVSIETASNLEHSDPWTPQQIAALIDLGVWLHHRHGIPLRICRTADDAGYGYHSLHRAWSTSGTACPGAARIRQFREVVFPGIVAAAQGVPVPAPAPVPQPPVPVEEFDMPILGGHLIDGYDPVGNLIIPPSVPHGRKMFLNIGADMGAVRGRVDIYVTGQGWRPLGEFTVDTQSDLAFFELPRGTRKVNVKRLPGPAGSDATPAAWNIEVV
jgi:hypothetical protein